MFEKDIDCVCVIVLVCDGPSFQTWKREMVMGDQERESEFEGESEWWCV